MFFCRILLTYFWLLHIVSLIRVVIWCFFPVKHYGFVCVLYCVHCIELWLFIFSSKTWYCREFVLLCSDMLESRCNTNIFTLIILLLASYDGHDSSRRYYAANATNDIGSFKVCPKVLWALI